MPRTPKEPTTIELGLPGLKTSGGLIDEEQLVRLKGIRAATIYEEMSQNDPIVGASLYAIEGFLRRVNYVVKPADGSDAAKREADFVRSCMDDMDAPWGDVISDILSMLVYGFSLHEIVYKYRRGLDQSNARFRSRYDDGRVGWRNIACRAQKTICYWDIDPESGEILGAYQSAAPKYQEVLLPMSRCVLFRTKSYKNNPEGVSVLRRAYRPWFFKKRLEEIEATGVLRDLNGLPVFTLPVSVMSPNATPAQKNIRNQFQTMGSLLARDQLEALVIPASKDAEGKETGYGFSLASSNGSKASPADPIIRRYDSRIAMTLAAEFILLGTEKTGSFALAAEKSSHFVKTLEWYAGVICAQLNAVCVRRLMEVNNVPQERWPSINYAPIDIPDIKDLGLFLQQISGAGLITPTVELEGALRSAAKLPEPSDDEVTQIEERIARGTEPAPAPPDPTPPVVG